MQTADNHFLANHQVSYWARGLYSQAMDRDAVDASDDANALALALAERMMAICLNKPIPSTATELVDSPHSSLWLIHALLQAWTLEPFKTSQEAETLAVALGGRAGRACPLPYSQAMKKLRVHVLQVIASSAVE